MTKQEFDEKRQELVEKHKKEHTALSREYCTSLVEELGLKTGDILKDRITEEVGKYLRWKMSDIVEPVFVCEWLKKDGTPRKKYEEISIYYSRLSKEL